MIVKIKFAVSFVVVCSTLCGLCSCSSKDKDREALDRNGKKASSIDVELIDGAIESIEKRPVLHRKIDDVVPDMLDFEKTKNMLRDENGVVVKDYRHFKQANEHLRILIAALLGKDSSEFMGYSGYIRTLADNTCASTNRYCIHDFDDRLLPFVQKALLRVLTEEDKFDGPSWKVRDSAKPLIETLGARPHVSSIDVLMKAVFYGKKGKCPRDHSGAEKILECQFDASKAAMESLIKCTNGVLLEKVEERCDIHWRDASSAQIIEVLMRWTKIRPKLEERGLLGAEPTWGVLQPDGMMYVKRRDKKALFEMKNEEIAKYIEEIRKEERRECVSER